MTINMDDIVRLLWYPVKNNSMDMEQKPVDTTPPKTPPKKGRMILITIITVVLFVIIAGVIYVRFFSDEFPNKEYCARYSGVDREMSLVEEMCEARGCKAVKGRETLDASNLTTFITPIECVPKFFGL